MKIFRRRAVSKERESKKGAWELKRLKCLERGRREEGENERASDICEKKFEIGEERNERERDKRGENLSHTKTSSLFKNVTTGETMANSWVVYHF